MTGDEFTDLLKLRHHWTRVKRQEGKSAACPETHEWSAKHAESIADFVENFSPDGPDIATAIREKFIKHGTASK